MHKLGTIIKDKKPEVKKLIEKKRYVDDLGDSKNTRDECSKLANDADKVFAMVNLKCRVRPIWSYRYRYRYSHTDIQQTDTDTDTPFKNLGGVPNFFV